MATPAQLRLIADKMAANVTHCTRDFRYVWVSSQCAEWIQRPVEKIVGKKIQDVLGSEAFLRLLPYFERVLSGETVTYEDKVAYSSIGKRWISATYTPTLDSGGKVDGWVAVIRDITNEKTTEAALLEREKQLSEEVQALANLNEYSLRLWRVKTVPEGLDEMLRAVMQLLGADKGNVQILDHERSVLTVAAQRGFEQEFLDNFREVSAIDDSACGRALRGYEQVVIEDTEKDAGFAPHRQIARAAGFRAVVSTPLICRDGKALGVLSTHFRSVHRPTNQELRSLELYVRRAADFIERCRWEESLRENQKATALLAAIVTSSDDAIVSKNLDGIIQSWNRGAERIFGYTAKEAIGQHITLIIPTDRCSEEDDIQARLRRGERIDSFQTARRRKDGTTIDVSVTISPIRDSSGRVIGASKVARDITEQKRTGEELRLMTAQDEEQRRIARELHDSAGQTLTVLGMSLSQLVRKAELVAPDLAREGREIEKTVQQLHREIRTTSYLLHPPLLDEGGLDSALRCYVQGVAQRSGIGIDLNISEDLGRLPAEMELAIFRVVQECLTNIHRHSGSSTALIRLARDSENVRVEVRDEGRGIPGERLAEIQSGVSGVGFRGMQERLRQFGGAMTIESDGSGTSVAANIPVPNEVRSVNITSVQTEV